MLSRHVLLAGVSLPWSLAMAVCPWQVRKFPKRCWHLHQLRDLHVVLGIMAPLRDLLALGCALNPVLPRA